MVQETEIPVFSLWIWDSLLYFAEAALLLGLAALVVGYLVAAFRHGPLGGGDVTYRMLKTGVRDVVSLSPRRIFALARLAVKESIRRNVLVGLAVFVLLLIFAGWFLDTNSDAPAALHLSFVLTATSILVLMMALVLSVFSLPADFKSKTVYTIVTKPVRPGEIVLGRILGFSFIGTLLLVTMGIVSYIFVQRTLDHTHEVDVATLTAPAKSGGAQTGRSTKSMNHHHQVTIDSDGGGSTDMAQGHYHEIHSETVGDTTKYVMGPPEGLLMARVPAYARALRFKDRGGQGSLRGINVGNEWKYRSYIDGGTLAAAIWTFDNVTPERYPDGLPLEMTIRVFRSYKGDVEKPIEGSIVLKNPRTQRASRIFTFPAKDAQIYERTIPRALVDQNGKALDLFNDLAPDGEVEVWLQCIDFQQYFGVAKADMYLRARDASFGWNFFKSYLAIWVQMVLVTSFGVMYSTFLTGPVAMLATLATVLMGFFREFVFNVAKGGQGGIEGGGPVESFIRLIKQQNVTTQMEPGLTKEVVQAADHAFMSLMTSVASLLPDFNKFSNVDYLAHGFDIPGDIVLVQVFTVLGYVAAVFAIGYFFLRTREVAR